MSGPRSIGDLAFGVLVAAYILITGGLLFMWAILYGVLEDVGYRKGDRYTAMMVIGTMFGAISGQAAKPFTGSALMMVGAYEKVAKTQLDYLPYMWLSFTCIIVTITLAYLGKAVNRVPVIEAASSR